MDDAASALIPMFVFMLVPVVIPIMVALVGWLSDRIGGRSQAKAPPRRAGSGR